MSETDLSVVIVAYHSGDELARSIESASVLKGVAASVVVVNNEPDDDTPAHISRRHGATCLQSERNVGFCTAVNRALAASRGKYVLLLNPDALVAPDYAARLIERLECDRTIGSAAGRILRGKPGMSRYVDSVGLTMLPGRRPADLLHGARDDGTRRHVSEVFGVTGAAALYPRAALEDVAVGGAVLPDEFFMYLDDVDLAWRLRLRGYRSVVDHAALAWHSRARAGGDNEPARGVAGLAATMRREALRPDYVRERSWVNQLLMIVRNDEPDLFLRQLPRMALLRSRVDAFGLVQRPSMALSARRRFAELLPAAIEQRRLNRKRRLATAADMARWLP